MYSLTAITTTDQIKIDSSSQQRKIGTQYENVKHVGDFLFVTFQVVLKGEQIAVYAVASDVVVCKLAETTGGGLS